MGVEVDREKPFYFTKSAQMLQPSGTSIPYPPGTSNFHFEMELVIAIGKPAFKLGVNNALDAVYGYACGLDMTRRDLQLAERAKQRPWDLGKDVEQSAVISTITKAVELLVRLVCNASRCRSMARRSRMRNFPDLIWKVEEIISHLSGFYHLAAGDYSCATGTPAGVGRLWRRPDRGTIDGLDPISLAIGPAE
ncbi:MAG: fumarylacetoacetate hydrolase family protein [Nitratireductor sp.]